MNRPSARFIADCHTFSQTVGEPFSTTDPMHHQPHQPLWLQATRLTPWPGVMGVLGGLAAFALLLAFSQVVSDGVEQGALRRSTLAMQAAPIWRCDSTEQKLLRRCASDADNRIGSAEAHQVRVNLDKPASLTLATR
jgi:hypothetical protein